MKPPVNPVRLEELGLSAWPALEETRYEGWILRFADGHTKRANSVNPLYPSTIDVEEKIAACERAHEEHGLPAIFRLTPFSEPATLDQALDARDYSMIDRTLVMTRSIANFSAPPSDFSIRPVDAETWLDTFERFDLLSPVDMKTRRRMIGHIPSTVVAGPTDRPAGINLGVHDGAAVGLFALFVTEERRLQGLGRALVEETLTIAAALGATLAYLQVEELNLPARALYERLGFTEAYPYWHRVRCE